MLSNIKPLKADRGFTIVELLIVIVVIAILAAITIVAYNGIQTRARDTSALASAGSLAKKMEAFNSITGAYPVWNTTGNITAQLATKDESTLTGTGLAIVGPASGVTSTNGTSTMQVILCGAAALTNGTTATGYQIYVFNYNAGSGVKLAQSGGTTTTCTVGTGN